MPKPIKIKSITVYMCPICDLELECSYREAQKHVNIPLAQRLPIGLVYHSKELIINPNAYFVILKQHKVQNDHDIEYHNINFTLDGLRRLHNWLDAGEFNEWDWGTINSREFYERLRKGEITLLTPTEFKKFEMEYNEIFKKNKEVMWKDFTNGIRIKDLREGEIKRFVRITPELEALVA